jgi:TPR repeat protein
VTPLNRACRAEVKATEFYRAASDGGDAEAAYCLGMCYHSGSGVAKDEAKALEQYLRAASQGHLEAQKSLVVCYAMGYGCREADQAKAMRYCRLAAENGDPEMMYQVAARLEAGNGSARDTDRAQHFYRKAAAAGHQGAAQLLAANAKSEFVLTRPFGTTPGW